MAKIGFVVNGPDGRGADLGDLLVPRDFFTSGSLYWCGRDLYILIGDSLGSYRSTPAQLIVGGSTNAAKGWKQISNFTGIKTDGTLWSFGTNLSGQLGDNTTTDRSSPVQTIAGGTNWKQVSSDGQTTFSIKSDGTLWGWGSNGNGVLGDSTTSNKSSPIQTISRGTDWKQVSCETGCVAAIKTDGTLWTWGRNGFGQLGDNTTVPKSSPIQTIAGGTNWKQVSCGYNVSSAIKTDGTLWIWGQDNYGQLGDGTKITGRSSPVQTITGGTNWKQVSCGTQSVSAIKTDGTLWTWGRNYAGELGINSSGNSVSSPVQTVAAGTNWKQVSSGQYNTAAIKTDGTLWTWGKDNYGQLGDSTTTNRSSPVQTILGGTNWKYVEQSGSVLLALTDDS